MIHLTPQARRELRGDEVLVFEWHRIAICCAAAGDVSLRRAPRSTVEARPKYRPLPTDHGASVFAHRMAVPHLVGRDVTVDCRRTLGMRRFSSNLPPDFGLRAVLGRAPKAEGGSS